MQNGSLENVIIGGFFVLVGLILVVFRKEFKELNESFYKNLPETLGLLRARGRLLTVVIVTSASCLSWEALQYLSESLRDLKPVQLRLLQL